MVPAIYDVVPSYYSISRVTARVGTIPTLLVWCRYMWALRTVPPYLGTRLPCTFASPYVKRRRPKTRKYAFLRFYLLWRFLLLQSFRIYSPLLRAAPLLHALERVHLRIVTTEILYS